MSKRDQTYEATRLHFENLVKRYGNPIIILNLIKAREFNEFYFGIKVFFQNKLDRILFELFFLN